MFLKSLDIFGFKSFADKTHIEFADGITALLGPNGCGKSNVVDAIKWVLAENRAKNLRASSMESVIFNGTENRSALNVAEVTLTISNENNLLPLDESEIALKRRLYRTGENEYFINNKAVGAIDIRRLFLDTGVGKSAYSVMEQGKIDQILSSKPEDRRYIFEEAAGISRSKAEVAEAERELERTQQNLEKIEVALNENKRIYETLKIQSEKTLRYRALKEEIFQDEIDIQLLRLKKILERKEKVQEQKTRAEKQKSDTQTKIDFLLENLAENNEKSKSFQIQLAALQQEVVRIQAEKTGKSAMAKKLNLDASQAKEKVAQLEIHKKTITERIETLNDEIDEEDFSLHEKTKRIADVKKNIESFEKNIEDAQNQILENEKANAQNEEISNEKRQKIAEFEKKLESITGNIVRDLDARLRDSKFSAANLENAKENLDKIIGNIRVLAEGRLKLFQEWQKLKFSQNDAGKFLTEAISSLEKIAQFSKDAENAANDYKNAIPSFFDEFLSPEGIITKKREIDSKIESLKMEIDERQKANEKRQKENDDFEEKIDDFKDALSKMRVSEAQMAEQISAGQKQTELLRRQLSQEKTAFLKNEDELFAQESQKDEILEQLEEIQNALFEIEEKGAACVDEINALDEKIRECNKNSNGQQEELKKKQAEQRNLQAQCERLNFDLLQAQSDEKNIRQNFLDSHSRELSEFEERTIEKSEENLREELLKKREEFRMIGQVNLMAVEEFAEAKARYEKLKANAEDSQKSVDDLFRVSEEIKAKSAELFLETYSKIRKNFHNMFRRLFGGGRGELKLTDGQNVLTSGIDIFAQPPGKKLENIALLSGGEKTMTAVALLFATYQVRPSPFCLLDEIDAALDDKNVASFVNALRSFSKLSQYIVITHNKKTVLGAKSMLGVTMEESGVSKIIAVRLERETDDYNEELFDEIEDFEEDVPEEIGIREISRPPARIHNSDGTISDPFLDEQKRKSFKTQN